MEAGGLLPRQPQQGPPGSVCGTGGLVQGANNPNSNNQSPVHDLNQLQLQQQQQQMGQAPGMGEVLAPKRQAVVDRLKRRIDHYRQRTTECIPRHNNSFSSVCEQNIQETLVLKQRFVENNKAKRQPKKTDKKQNESVSLAGIHVVSHINIFLLWFNSNLSGSFNFIPFFFKVLLTAFVGVQNVSKLKYFLVLELGF